MCQPVNRYAAAGDPHTTSYGALQFACVEVTKDSTAQVCTNSSRILLVQRSDETEQNNVAQQLRHKSFKYCLLLQQLLYNASDCVLETAKRVHLKAP